MGTLQRLLGCLRGVGDQRFGQPGARVVLALQLGGMQAVDGQACRHGDQPGVLHHVVGFGGGAQHAVGHGVQPRPQAGEGAGVGFVVHRVDKMLGPPLL